MAKLIVIVAVIAAGYWYWSGPYQAGRAPSEAQQLQQNARDMKRCMRSEASMNAASGMAGAPVADGDGETLCAQKYGLVLRNGQWHSEGAERVTD